MRKMNQYNKLDQWLHRQATSLEDKFGDPTNTAIYFADFDNHPEGERLRLVQGCDIIIYDRVPLVSFMIRCFMIAGVILPLHHHPDYIEGFYMVSGTIVDLVSGKTYTAGDFVTFEKMITHHIECSVDAEISIKCTYTG